MSCTKPHFLLFCDGSTASAGDGIASQRGRWKFVLEDVATGEKTEASDIEPGCPPDRSALISVLRGLESLEQPSRVTLVTPNRYVTRGLLYGLNEWRDNDFSWEHFGAVQPIRNADLWRRIDRTLAYHQVQCRWMPSDESAGPGDAMSGSDSSRYDENSNSDCKSDSVSSDKCVATLARTKHTKTVRTIEKLQPGIYVDSAHAFRDISQQNDTQAPALSAESPALNSSSIDPLLHKLPQVEICHDLSLIHGSILFSKPSMMVGRTVGRANILCRHIWDVIMAIDEWLESFLRCLVLLNPRDRRK